MLFSGLCISNAKDLLVYSCERVYAHIKAYASVFIEWNSEIEVERVLAV